MPDTNIPLNLEQTKSKLVENMNAHQIAAIIWNPEDTRFQPIPEIVTSNNNGNPESVRITGMYCYDGKLYAIVEGADKTDMEYFYRPGIDVPPQVVTLTEDKAHELFGNPAGKEGFTTAGTLVEWALIAVCYVDAITED